MDKRKVVNGLPMAETLLYIHYLLSEVFMTGCNVMSRFLANGRKIIYKA